MCDYNNVFKKIARLRSKEAELKAEREALEEEIKKYMQAEGIAELLGKEHKATYTEVESMKFNSNLFKAEHADMYEAFKRPSKSMRFTFN